MEAVAPVGGLIVFLFISYAAIRAGLEKRPTFKEADERYKKSEVCNEIHKAAEEKLKCIPQIKADVTKTKIYIKLLLKKNGIPFEDDEGK